MKRLGAFLLLTATILSLGAQEIPNTTERLESLDAEQIKRAIDTLRQTHVRGSEVDELQLNKATLRGLIESLAPGAELTGEEAPPPAVSAFRSEILDGRAGYLRLGSLQSENLAELDVALRDFAERKVHGVILDLRATPDSSDFALAAQVAGRFCPPGTTLFSLTGPSEPTRDFVSSGDPLYRGVLVVLIDEKTSGAAEALAATLRWNARALLVGTRSSGRCVDFTLIPLGGGHNLRLAAAEIRIAGQAIYPRGLRPDIEVPQDPQVRETILSEALEKGMSGFVFEKGRVQLNEAALVAGTNPEINSEQRELGLLDRPLQRAVDLVTAIKLFRKAD
jgi:C-terminal processing protease CtpA/Prc